MDIINQHVSIARELLVYMDSDQPFDKDTWDSLFAEYSAKWNKIQFTFDFNLSNKDIVDFFGNQIQGHLSDDITIKSTELYQFIRLILVVCALDSYGPCATVSQAEKTLEHGIQFLQGGILQSLRTMRPWTFFGEAFQEWKPFFHWILQIKNVIWFSNKLTLDEDHELNIRWKQALKNAIDKLL